MCVFSKFCAVVCVWKGGLFVLCEGPASALRFNYQNENREPWLVSAGLGRCFLNGRFGVCSRLTKGRSLLLLFCPLPIGLWPVPLAGRLRVCSLHCFSRYFSLLFGCGKSVRSLEEEEELHNKPVHAVPLASARQHPETKSQKEKQKLTTPLGSSNSCAARLALNSMR